MMKRILMLAALVCMSWAGISGGAYADQQCRQRAYEDYQRALVDCDTGGESGQIVCVPNCISRYSNGTCHSYGSDYCARGRGVACVEQCISRYANGVCHSYGSDFCGNNFPNCSINCIDRYSNGTCRAYGSDICSQ